jgi:hypothetical protein
MKERNKLIELAELPLPEAIVRFYQPRQDRIYNRLTDVYSQLILRNNLDYTTEFEENFNNLMNSTEDKLKQDTSTAEEPVITRKRKINRRPYATAEDYKSAVENGLTLEEFKANYNFKKRLSIGGWARYHGQLRQATDITEEPTVTRKTKKKRIRRSYATAEDYKLAVEQGLTREEFEKKYLIKNNYSYGGWGRQYGTLKK